MPLCLFLLLISTGPVRARFFNVPQARETHIVLLDDLLKASIVQLRELGQVMHIGNDITQVLLQQHKVILRRYILLFCRSSISIPGRLRAPLIQAPDHKIDFLLTGFDPSYNLSGLDTLKSEDFVEFALQLCNKGFLVIFGPGSPVWVRVLRCRIILVGGFESVLKVVVGYVVVEIIF